MSGTALIIVLLALAAVAFHLGRRRAFAVSASSGGTKYLHSLPNYYGSLTALWCALPAIVVFGLWMSFEPQIVESLVVADLPAETRTLPPDRLNLVINDIRNLAEGNIVSGEVVPEMRAAADHYLDLRRTSAAAAAVVVLAIAIAGLGLAWRRVSPALRARNQVEQIVRIALIASSTVAIFTTLGIVLSVLFEAILFFGHVGITDFLFGLDWSPQMAIREDQVGSSGAFGAIPLFAGTALISFIAMTVAAPIGLFAAIYLAEYATPAFRSIAKPALEILAGVPTVVYGYFAALVVAPLIRDSGAVIGLDVASESALAAGLVMGVMIIPFVSSLSDDVINAVPQALRDGWYGLGATQSETIRQVVLPAALPGIVGGMLLAVSRAVGETMIVVMAAGLAANLTANPLQAVTTVTVQIVTLLVGDQEFDSPKTLAAFALGLVLFTVTLCLNVIALQVVRKYREQYD